MVGLHYFMNKRGYEIAQWTTRMLY